MEPEQYFNLFQYLSSKLLPPSLSTQQQQQFIKQTKKYIIKDNLLFKEDKKNQQKLYRVIQKEEMPTVLYMMHNDPTSGHLGIEYNRRGPRRLDRLRLPGEC